MFGPLFRYELARLARRGLQPRLRAAFALLLLLALLLAYLAAFPGVSPRQLLTHIDEPLSTEAASRFGERFVVAFLVIQTLMVLAVTPVLAAGAIAEEKDRRSLDLLLTTPMSDGEIVAGKLAARVVFVGMLLLTGLPVVVLTVFFGGVDAGQLAVGYGLALFTVCSVGAFSQWMAVWRRTLGGALVWAYLVVAFVSLAGLVCYCFRFPAFLSPLGVLVLLITGYPYYMVNQPAEPITLLVWYGVVHTTLTGLFLYSSSLWLRNPQHVSRLTVMLNLPAQPRDDDLPPVPTPEPGALPFRLHNVPPVDDADPLVWKERYFGVWPSASADIAVAVFVGVGATLLVLVFALPHPRVAAEFARAAVALTGLTALAVVGFCAAGSVARERHQGTLDSLLALPIARRDILLAKAKVAAWLAGWPVAFAVVAVMLALFRGAAAWPSVFGTPVVLAGWVTGAVGFGLWLSVRCATRERAVAWFLGVFLAASVLMPLLGRILGGTYPDTPEDFLAGMVRGFSPAVGLWSAVLTPREWDASDVAGWQFTGAVAAAFVVGMLGVALGVRAARRFERGAFS